jgi:type I restriction enzyme S subunit
MKFGKIKIGEISNTDKFKAAYHLSDGHLSRKIIANSPFPIEKIKAVSSRIFYGGRAKRVYINDEKFGIPFVESSDMLKSDFFNLKLISKKYTKNLDAFFVKKGWTLVSRSGTIGNTAYTNKEFDGKAASEHIIRVIPNDKIYSGYLYAYLSSKYGYNLLTQGTFGAVILHIEPDYIADLPIPLPPEGQQQAIHNLIEQSATLREEANVLLREEIEKKYYTEEKKEKVFIINTKDIFNGDKYTNEKRLEVDYYQPNTQGGTEKIKEENWALLGDLSSDITISNLRARTFVKKGITLFTGQALGLTKPDESKQLSMKLTKNITQNITRNDDILVSAFGTLGKTELAFNNFYTGIFASQQLCRIRTVKDKIHSGYLFLLLKSLIGQKQILKFKIDSAIEWLNSHNFTSIVVPIPKDARLRLGEIAYEICNKRYKALNLENAAITQLENTIALWQN